MPTATASVHVHAVRIDEAVSSAFRIEVDFDTTSLDVDACRGADVALVLQDIYGNERHLSGMVDQMDILGTSLEEERTRFRATLRPRLHLLTYRHGCRIFPPDLTVVEIAQLLLSNADLDAALLDVTNLTETYPSRTYCVQYNESEWDFLCRLLEESGIWFRFRYEPDGHVMELGDNSTKADEVDTVAFQPDPLRQGDGVYVWDWIEKSKASVGKATTNDYNPLIPSVPMLSEVIDTDDVFEREWYEFPARFADPSEGARLADARLQSLRSEHRTATCKANSIHIGAGVRAELTDHPFAFGEYFATRVQTQIRLTETAHADPLYPAGGKGHSVIIDWLPTAKRGLTDGSNGDPLLFRPALRTPRPKIFGVQTARVTGPEGEEVHCDELGRVKVQFHWDLEGQLDEKSSCWVRVGQSHTTGSIMIPRIGWEVLVEFEEGNPDRPLILGKVYNPIDPPAYELPAFKNVTGIRSESSPGRGGVNEIKFDDTAGQELLSVNAQYDFNVVCGNDKMENVGNISNRSVGGSRSVSIGEAETISVENNFKSAITGNQSISVGAARTLNISEGATHDVKGNWSKTVSGMEFLMVGSPGAAVIQFATQLAISKVVGGVAGLASKGKLSSLPLIGPAVQMGDAAITKAQQTVGPLGQLAGPAAQMLAPGNTMAATAGSMVGGILSGEQGASDVGNMAQGVLTNQVAGKLAKDVTKLAMDSQIMGGGGGGSAGGGADGTEASGGESATGIGEYITIAGGDVTESIGAASILLSLKGINRGIGGNSIETIGAARLEAFGGSKSESISVAKAETVGALFDISAADGYTLSAKAIVAYNVATAFKIGVGDSHALTAKSGIKVKTSKSSFKAGESVSLTCGPATKVVISSKGIEIQGALTVTLKASKITADPPAIVPG